MVGLMTWRINKNDPVGKDVKDVKKNVGLLKQGKFEPPPKWKEIRLKVKLKRDVEDVLGCSKLS
jgi:hypothetical protein